MCQQANPAQRACQTRLPKKQFKIRAKNYLQFEENTLANMFRHLSTLCTKGLIGRESELFSGSKEVAVVEEVDEVDGVDDDICCVIDGMDSEIYPTPKM